MVMTHSTLVKEIKFGSVGEVGAPLEREKIHTDH